MIRRTNNISFLPRFHSISQSHQNYLVSIWVAETRKLYFFHYFYSILTFIFLLCGLIFSLPVSAVELPLSVSPAIASPGETATVSGIGFQEGARALVWGGGPFVTGNVDTPGFATDVAIARNYAYVMDDSRGLQVIDISNPQAPEVVGSVNTPGLALGVALVGNYAYVADAESGLLVIDISNPQAPAVVGRANTPGSARHVAITGNYAYVADGSSGLQVIDISNPHALAVVGSADTPGRAFGVAIAGNYAYVADTSSGLQVIDISNPEGPAVVGNVDTPGSARHVAIAGNYTYVTDDSRGLQVIDISNPQAPVLVASTNTPGLAVSVALVDNYAYVADAESGLQVIDISNPQESAVVGRADTPDWAFGVAIFGNYAYVADGSSGLQVIDISNPQAPALIGSIGSPSRAISEVIDGNYVYATGSALSKMVSAIPSSTVFSNSTTLEIVLPSHLPGGTYDVTVLNPDGTVYKSHNAITISEGIVLLDSDDDGISDAYEDQHGLDKNNPDDAQDDNDTDELTNIEEFEAGTNPFSIDSDSDGSLDGYEVAAGTDPLDPLDFPYQPVITTFWTEIEGIGGLIVDSPQSDQWLITALRAQNGDIDAIKNFQCHSLSICSGSPTTNGYGNFGPQTSDAVKQLFINQNVKKTFPNGWVVKVTDRANSTLIITTDNGVDRYRWYKVEDVTDGVTGWMVAGKLDTNNMFIDEYLAYEPTQQTDLKNIAITTQVRSQ